MDEKFVRPRPNFPKRAIVTSGMPNGGKHLTFAHVGLMLRADTFARFLRDRIGKDNVIFVSGTDCYGSPALESYRKFVAAGKVSKDTPFEQFSENIYHEHQRTFEEYNASFNLYGASAFGQTKAMHKLVSDEFIRGLDKMGMIEKQDSWQFYDESLGTLLNGRQVVGKCPVEGCQGECGYADECDVGHQYLPQDLIDPVSTLSGKRPKLVKVENLYFKLDECFDGLNMWLEDIERRSDTPSFMVKELKEFLKKPEIYIKKEFFDKFEAVRGQLPHFTEVERKPGNPSMTIIFDKLKEREKACEILSANGIRYRTGKTLTPLRLTGNLDWGVPCPEIKGVKGLTLYVWPESLWAPISFTRQYLKNIGKGDDEWKKYWCSDESEVYQFIGEDNLYFYGPAQQAMWLKMSKEGGIKRREGELHLTRIIPIKTLLLGGLKAGSSGSIKAPLAEEILQHYTPEQYRMHFLGMNLGNNNVSFMPKAFNPNATADEADPAVKEGNLLTNVFNRILRTIIYSCQKNFDGALPYSEIDEDVKETCKKACLDYERFTFDKKFHQVINTIDVFVRNINKYWVKEIDAASADKAKMAKLCANTTQYIRTAITLLHPMSQEGTEKATRYMGFDERIFNWDYIFEDAHFFMKDPKNHKFLTLKEKEDFFKKHPSQLVEDK